MELPGPLSTSTGHGAKVTLGSGSYHHIYPQLLQDVDAIVQLYHSERKTCRDEEQQEHSIVL